MKNAKFYGDQYNQLEDFYGTLTENALKELTYNKLVEFSMKEWSYMFMDKAKVMKENIGNIMITRMMRYPIYDEMIAKRIIGDIPKPQDKMPDSIYG